jgi:hypothetical protein
VPLLIGGRDLAKAEQAADEIGHAQGAALDLASDNLGLGARAVGAVAVPAGGGGYAINIGAEAKSLRIVDSKRSIGTFRAEIEQEDGHCELLSAERKSCKRCATALWLFSPEWPKLVHPFASAIDTDLPVPRTTVHMMLRFKPAWVVPHFRRGDARFDLYPEQSLEEWHRAHGLWAG